LLVIAGQIEIDPAHREVAVAAAIDMMEATRREPGCISYTFSGDLADPGRFRLFEEWESQEALDAHFASPHMARFQKALGGFGIKDMQVKRYEIAKVGPLGG
jgi:quinol monooxygenase YgiN